MRAPGVKRPCLEPLMIRARLHVAGLGHNIAKDLALMVRVRLHVAGPGHLIRTYVVRMYVRTFLVPCVRSKPDDTRRTL